MMEIKAFRKAKTKITKKRKVLALGPLPEKFAEVSGKQHANQQAKDAIEKHASSLNFHGADYATPREHYKNLRAVAAIENIFVEHGENPLLSGTTG